MQRFSLPESACNNLPKPKKNNAWHLSKQISRSFLLVLQTEWFFHKSITLPRLGKNQLLSSRLTWNLRTPSCLKEPPLGFAFWVICRGLAEKIMLGRFRSPKLLQSSFTTELPIFLRKQDSCTCTLRIRKSEPLKRVRKLLLLLTQGTRGALHLLKSPGQSNNTSSSGGNHSKPTGGYCQTIRLLALPT